MRRLGILGGGQLARMLALAAYPLGIRTLCLDPSSEPCARDVTEVITADFADGPGLRQFLAAVDLVTYETENIPMHCAELVAQTHPLRPGIAALHTAQDRLHEKTFFNSLGIPTPAFADIQTETELQQAAASLGLPAVLKTRRLGYDGKGQIVIHTPAEIANAGSTLKNQALILEAFIPFEYEVSLIAVRNHQGEMRFYPLVRNQHKQGILQSSAAPFDHPELQQQAEVYVSRILSALDYTGVLTVEFFYDGQQLLANEMAPRVHNSGHWTIEGAQTSQFENHLRAILDWPLGSTTPTGHCLMLNCLGEIPPPSAYLHIPGVHYHTYGKSARPGRKLGHITLVDRDLERFNQNLNLLLSPFEKGGLRGIF